MNSYINAIEARKRTLFNGGKLYESKSLDAAYDAIFKAIASGDFRAIASDLNKADIAELKVRGYDVFTIPGASRYIITW